jgi:beta-lactamase regulating signal transducer with metallopeptidase domain/peroxiredoxin
MKEFFSWFVINSVWQPTFLLLLGVLLTPLLRRMNASSRVRFWAALILLSTVLPTLSAIRIIHPSMPAASIGPRYSDHSAWARISESGAITIPLREAILAPPHWFSLTCHLLLAFYVLMLVSAIVRLGRALWQTVAVMAESVSGSVHPEIREVVTSYCDRLGISVPKILYSPRVKCAATIDWVQPVLLLPLNFAEFSPSEIRTALAHELAHIKRRDFFFNLTLEILSLSLPFHPAARRMKAQFDASRECACDEVGQSLIESRTEYARSLLQIVSRTALARGGRDLCLGVAGTPAVLEMRFASLLEGPAPERVRTLASTVTYIALGLIAVVLSMLHLETRSATSRSVNALDGAGSQVIEASLRNVAPNFSLTALNGDVVQLSDYRGEYVVLNFWATWCRPCTKESSDLNAIEADYRGKGLKVVGISVDSGQAEATRAFVRTHASAYEILLGSDSVLNRYSLGSVPSTFLIDREGKIAMIDSAAIDPKQMRRHIDELLNGS